MTFYSYNIALPGLSHNQDTVEKLNEDETFQVRNEEDNNLNVYGSAQDINWGNASSPPQSSPGRRNIEENKSDVFNLKSVNNDDSKNSSNIHDM